MASEKKITGAIGGGGRVYRAGDEEAFAEFLKTDAGKKVDLQKLTETGHIVGYTGGEAVPQIIEPVNRQRFVNGQTVAETKGKKLGKGKKAAE